MNTDGHRSEPAQRTPEQAVTRTLGLLVLFFAVLVGFASGLGVALAIVLARSAH